MAKKAGLGKTIGVIFLGTITLTTCMSMLTESGQVARPPAPPPKPPAAKVDAPVLPKLTPKEKAQSEIAGRKAYAKLLEEGFLKQGISVDVTTRGNDAKTLHYKYALVSKAFTYQVQHNSDFVSTCRELGFKKMILTDGFRETYELTF